MPVGAPVAATDAELAELAAAAHATGGHLVASVNAGDVLRTLGLDRPRVGDETIAYPMDLGFVELITRPDRAGERGAETGAGGEADGDGRPEGDAGSGGQTMPFVSHVLAGSAVWAPAGGRSLGMRNDPRRLTCVMNAAWAGPFRLGPRAHLNDGRLDVTDGRLALSELREARRRALSGSHLPHPDLTVKRVGRMRLDFERRRMVWVDGVPVGHVGAIEVSLVADALTVVA